MLNPTPLIAQNTRKPGQHLQLVMAANTACQGHASQRAVQTSACRRLVCLSPSRRGNNVTIPTRVVQGEAVQGRVLLCADGATSRLASHMGYCTEPPRGVCSRAFVEGGTHNTDFDGAFLPLCRLRP